MSLGARRAPAAREWMGASPHWARISRCKLLVGESTYTFHPKSSTAIHHLEKVFILLTPEPAQSGDFKVGPEMAHVVLFSFHGFGVNSW